MSAAEGVYLLGQIVQGLLNRGYGSHHAHSIHPGYRLAFLHAVPVFHQVLCYLYALRHRNAHRCLSRQLAASQHLGFQIPELRLAGEYAGLMALLLPGGRRHGHYCQQQHQCPGAAPGDIFLSVCQERLRLIRQREPAPIRAAHWEFLYSPKPFLCFFKKTFHGLNLHSAGRRWASFWQPYWPDTVRRPGRL